MDVPPREDVSMVRVTEELLCGDGCTVSAVFGTFKHSDFHCDSEDGTIENVDDHIVRLYRKRFQNVRFNRRNLEISYDE
jgi:hypothetical protein